MRITSFLAAVTVAAASSTSFAAMTQQQIDARVNDLLARMTVDEKVGQLNQLSGYGFAPDMVERIRSGQVGTMLNEVDPATCNKLQREAVENSRLGIPLIFARDVIHGFKTMMPIPLGQAATWNAALVEQGARVAAIEATAAGVRWTFSPMVDIARDARWGRIAEGYGEDPLLTATLGAATVRGYQGNELADPTSMAACMKHFACYGASEGGRDYNTTWVPKSLLHDTYLPPFKACADAGAATVMCSFNDINGVPSSGNAYLLTDVLRNQWQWPGVVVSDWNSIGEMINHGFSADLAHAATQAANAGVDVDMESKAYAKNLAQLVNSGLVPMQTLDNMVARVLRLKFALGLFDTPYTDTAKPLPYYSDEALAAARQTAEESAILLTNNGILPLQPGKRIFVTGPMADAKHDQNGTWSFDMEKDHTVTPLAALRQRYGNAVTYLPGLDYSRDRDTRQFKAALKAARKADVILYFAGEEAVLSGEAHCRADVSLPGAQTEYLELLKQAGKPVVTVVMTGRPNALVREAQLSDALVLLFHPGTMGGPAIANVLDGTVNPGGKLPASMPRMSGQTPLYYNCKNTGRPTFSAQLIDSIPLEAGQTSTGCTTFYLDAGVGPLFPFGYGLSYTTFAYSQPTLSAAEIDRDGMLTVSCTVTNTGKVAGHEVAQLYVRDPVASLARPLKELKGFQKLYLQPGESRQLKFNLPASALAFHDESGAAIVEPGQVQLWVDGSSDTKQQPVTFNIR